MRQSLIELGQLAGEAAEAMRRTVTLASDPTSPRLSQLYHHINGTGNGHTNGHGHSKQRKAKPLRGLFLQ